MALPFIWHVHSDVKVKSSTSANRLIQIGKLICGGDDKCWPLELVKLLQKSVKQVFGLCKEVQLFNPEDVCFLGKPECRFNLCKLVFLTQQIRRGQAKNLQRGILVKTGLDQQSFAHPSRSMHKQSLDLNHPL
jgi:hypothetical protein